jgi:ligand-binding sensor domain-containing protein/signal transduction histidine kinase
VVRRLIHSFRAAGDGAPESGRLSAGFRSTLLAEWAARLCLCFLIRKRGSLVCSCSGGRLRRGAGWFWAVGLPLTLAAGLARAELHPETQYAVRVWQAEQGLPENSVNCIAQTRDGYLWIGTFNGLVRFDGREFIWVGPEGVANERASRILCLYADDGDALWVGTDGEGVYRYYQGQWEHIAGGRELVHPIVLALTGDGDGGVWIGTYRGLNRWQKGEIAAFTDREGYGVFPETVFGLATDPVKGLWVAAEKHLYYFAQGRFEEVALPVVEGDASVMRTVHVGRDGRRWAGRWGEFLLHSQLDRWEIMSDLGESDRGHLYAIVESSTGEVWVGTDGGLSCYRDGRWFSFPSHDSLVGHEVRALFEDREGNIWAGGIGVGLTRIRRTAVTAFTMRHGLLRERVRAIREMQSQELWVGFDGGGMVRGLPGSFQPWELPSPIPPGASVWSLLRDRRNVLWIGTYGDGLWRQDADGVERVAQTAVSPAPASQVTALLQDNFDRIWVGTYQGLFRVVANNRLQPVPLPVPNRFLRAHVTSLLQDPAGILWVGYNGQGIIQVKDSRSVRLTVTNGLPSDFVRTLHADADGTIWIGTRSGLARWRAGEITAFTTADGLADDTISQILEDDAGYLWLGSNHGIMRIGKSSFDQVAQERGTLLSVRVFDTSDGPPANECTGGFHPAGHRGSDGRLWFATTKGLVAVNPQQVTFNSVPPDVFIDSIRVGSETVVSPGFGGRFPQTLKLSSGVRQLELRFSAVSLTAPEKVRYRTWLEGWDTDWTDPQPERVVSYSRLPPGNYRFQVMACNNDGVWSPHTTPLAFSVPPYWWQTWWAKAIAGMVAMLCVGGIVSLVQHRRHRAELRRIEARRAIEQERARIAQDLHDDLGAGLTQINLASAMAQNRAMSAEVVGGLLGDISTRARELVTALDEIVWAINPRNDTVASVASYFCQFAQHFLKPSAVTCRLNVAADLPVAELNAEQRHALFLAFEEALHNVVQHSGATQMELTITGENGNLRIGVRDNGRGLPAGSPPEGADGLRNMRERLDRLGGRCILTSPPGAGTIVTFNLPLAASAR